MNPIEFAMIKAAADRAITATAPDDVILANPAALVPWADNTAYAAGECISHGGQYYRCLMAHTSNAAAQWVPGAAPSIWGVIADPGEEWPAYHAPGTPVPGTTGSVYPPYMAGDKVTFGGGRYICILNNTTFSPAEYPAAWEVQP